MSVYCSDCGAVAGYGHELAHKSNCPRLVGVRFASEGSPPLEVLTCNGVGRDAEHDKSLCFYFNRKPTDDEMRYLHEVVERAAAFNTRREPDWPPRESAINFAEGVRRHGSTGQCFEVRSGQWVRV